MEERVVTVLLLGDEKCGKTYFLSRLSSGDGTGPVSILRDMDQPYIFDVKRKNKAYRLEIYDNNSPESWRLLQPDVVVICYDISQRLSLLNMQRLWIKEVRTTFQQIADNLPVLILGLKRDLRSEADPNGIIYPQEAYRMAQEMRADKYMECSAVTGELLKPAFEDICATAAKTKTAQGGQTPGGCVVM